MKIDKKILAKFKIRKNSHKYITIHYSIINDKIVIGFKYDPELQFYFNGCTDQIAKLLTNEAERFNYRFADPKMIKEFEWTIKNAIKENADDLGICDVIVEDKDAYIHDEYELGRHSWDTFRSTGLLTFVNSFLHIFGWAICVEYDDETKKVIGAFPARVPYRGFSINGYEQAYCKVSQYMKKVSDNLIKEANSDRITIDI